MRKTERNKNYPEHKVLVTIFKGEIEFSHIKGHAYRAQSRCLTPDAARDKFLQFEHDRPHGITQLLKFRLNNGKPAFAPISEISTQGDVITMTVILDPKQFPAADKL